VIDQISILTVCTDGCVGLCRRLLLYKGSDTITNRSERSPADAFHTGTDWSRSGHCSPWL